MSTTTNPYNRRPSSLPPPVATASARPSIQQQQSSSSMIMKTMKPMTTIQQKQQQQRSIPATSAAAFVKSTTTSIIAGQHQSNLQHVELKQKKDESRRSNIVVVAAPTTTLNNSNNTILSRKKELQKEIQQLKIQQKLKRQELLLQKQQLVQAKNMDQKVSKKQPLDKSVLNVSTSTKTTTTKDITNKENDNSLSNNNHNHKNNIAAKGTIKNDNVKVSSSKAIIGTATTTTSTATVTTIMTSSTNVNAVTSNATTSDAIIKNNTTTTPSLAATMSTVTTSSASLPTTTTRNDTVAMNTNNGNTSFKNIVHPSTTKITSTMPVTGNSSTNGSSTTDPTSSSGHDNNDTNPCFSSITTATTSATTTEPMLGTSTITDSAATTTTTTTLRTTMETIPTIIPSSVAFHQSTNIHNEVIAAVTTTATADPPPKATSIVQTLTSPTTIPQQCVSTTSSLAPPHCPQSLVAVTTNLSPYPIQNTTLSSVSSSGWINEQEQQQQQQQQLHQHNLLHQHQQQHLVQPFFPTHIVPNNIDPTNVAQQQYYNFYNYWNYLQYPQPQQLPQQFLYHHHQQQQQHLMQPTHHASTNLMPPLHNAQMKHTDGIPMPMTSGLPKDGIGYPVKPKSTKTTTTTGKVKLNSVTVLSKDPMHIPSPYAKTYEVVTESITLIKPNMDTSSFGVTLKLDMNSALVYPTATSSTEPKLTLVQPTPPPPMVPLPTTTNVGALGSESNITTLDNGTLSIPNVVSSAATSNMTDTVDNTTRSVVPPTLKPLDATVIMPSTLSENIIHQQEASDQTSSMLQQPPAIPVKQRRRRVFYIVLLVEDPSIQNSRTQSNTKIVLQKGDMILSINGTSVDGLTFAQACLLFKQCTTVSADNQFIECSVTIARRKPTTPKYVPKPLNILSSKSNIVDTMIKAKRNANDLRDLLHLSLGLLWNYFMADHRLLGAPIPTNITESIVSAYPVLFDVHDQKDIMYLNDLWQQTSTVVDKAKQSAAKAYWIQHWVNCPSSINLPSSKYFTDAQCHLARQRKQGLKRTRCRCLSYEHMYVNDTNCPLYYHLRQLHDATKTDNEKLNVNDQSLPTLTYPSTEQDIAKRSRTIVKNISRELNVMEKAYCDRFVRDKTENENLIAENEFIERMEHVQRTKTSQSLYAPNLTTIVLSAVAVLESEYADKALQIPPNLESIQLAQAPVVNTSMSTDTVPKISSTSQVVISMECDNDQDEEDDDDVPLMALCKRPNDGTVEDPSTRKRVKNSVKKPNTTFIHPSYLAKLLQYISTRWGHTYQEPSNEDYAWRWEVFHGQLSESGSSWEGHINPRKAFSLEQFRFVINDEFISQLEQQPDVNDAVYIKYLKTLACFISPNRCGIFDELMALIQTKVVSVQANGVPVLTKEWWSAVDILILDDMFNHWSTQKDVNGSFGVHPKIRKTLHRKWIRKEDGWALRSYEDDIIYEFDEFDEWRVAYESKQQSASDGIDGIGRFG